MRQLWVRRSLGLVVFLILAVAVTLRAQVTTAEILGTVLDNSGAVMANAKVTLTDVGTGEVRTMQTNTAGEYVFALLPIGSYTLTIESSGFSKFAESNVTVAAGDRARVDARMQVGQVSETVQVMAQAAALQTDSSTVTSTVTSTSVEDLPTNGRNFVTLVQLAAGMNESTQSSLGGGTRPDDRRQTSTISANGQNDSANNFLLDGMDNNERAIGTVIVKPSIDGLAEVQVESSLYPASVGRVGGAVVNEITKSGTNQYHGTVYEFFRNDALDAKYFFDVPEPGNPLAGSKPEYRQNQFGASFGGPIKKDKLFFFADFEEFRKIQGVTNSVLIPTACELGRASCNGVTQLGNFSDMTGVTIKTPGGAVVPNNIIPLSLISTVSQDYAALYPALPASACQGTTCLYNSAFPGNQFAHTGDARIDYQIDSRNTFYGRYSINQTSTFTPPIIPPVNVAGLTDVEGTGAPFAPASAPFPSTAYQRQQAFTLGATHIFTPSLLLQLGAQVNRYVTDSEGLNNGVNVNTAFGGPANINSPLAGTSGLALLSFSDYTGVGDQFALPTEYFDISYQYSGNLTWTRGRHSIKMGSSLIRRDWSVNQQLFKGTYMFNNSVGVGNDFAAMLEGDPFLLLKIVSLAAPQYRANEVGTYIQDDWHAAKWLTLNLGLRWDVFAPTSEKHNALSDFDPTNTAMLANGIVQQAGVNGVSATDGFKTQWGNFQPRLGFAASLGHGMVFRGGFGTTYFPDSQASPAYQKNAPITSSAVSVFPGFTAAPPTVPDSTCLVARCGATGTQSVPDATQLNFPWPIIYMVNMTLEKQIGSNVISAAFVGQYTRNLGRTVGNVDLPLPPNGPGGCGVSATSLPNPCQPYYSELPLVSSIQLLENNGTVNYNALQLRFLRRLSRGWTASANYSYTSNLADTGGPGGACGGCGTVVGDWAYDYGPSIYMVRHRFTITSNYQLPFGKNLRGVGGVVAKGWQLNGIYVYSTGQPFTVTDGLDTIGNSSGTERMDVLPATPGFKPTVGEYFDITRFRQQPFGTAGNEGENQFFAPPFSHLDLSLFKDFQLRESMRLQFRAECFNVINSPQFTTPNANISSYGPNGVPTNAGDFGAITNTNVFYTPREFQFALKLIF
jgi:hypothetical protein